VAFQWVRLRLLNHASIKEQTDSILATEMVSQLVDDHELIIRNLREHVDACGEQFMIRVQLTSNWLDGAARRNGLDVAFLH